MADIDIEVSYTIDDLLETWNKGWQRIKELAQSVYAGTLLRSGDNGNPPLDRVLDAFEDALDPSEFTMGSYLGVTDALPDHYEILNLAASSSKTPYAPAIDETVQRSMHPSYSTSLLGAVFAPQAKTVRKTTVGGRLGNWCKDKRILRRALRKATTALAESETFGEAFGRLASQENRKRYKDYWLQHRDSTPKECLTGYASRNARAAESEWLAYRVSPPLREIMKLLRTGVDDESSVESVWWNCLWVFMKPQIDDMLEAQKRIKNGVPIWMHQIDALMKYVACGRIRFDFVQFDDDGRHQMRVHVTWALHNEEWRSPFIQMTEFLLIQPVFALAQELHRYFDKPTYIRTCHSPKCLKRFFTQRRGQVVCPGSQGNRKNACGLAWTRYQRYLRKIGKDANKDWNTPALQQHFTAEDQP
jgi:hypothetical protein